MNIQEIIRNAGMSERPGYYSGRGATLSDLDSTILNKIAKSIKESYGNEAFNNFVSMVWNMKVLSATAFLNNLYALERANWNLSEISLTDSDAYFENEGEAMGLLASVLSRSSEESGFTKSIRDGFVKPK